MDQPDFTMSPEQYAALQQASHSGHMGDEVVFFCNAMPDDHLHARRLGPEGAGLGARVGIMAHSMLGGQTVTYLSAFEARILAASLMNIADEIDGDTPLAFFPPRFVDDADLDKPEQ